MGNQSSVDRWRRRNGVSDLELTPLVAARIAIRHRIDRLRLRLYLALLAIVGIAAVVHGLWTGWADPDHGPAVNVIGTSTSYLLINGPASVAPQAR